LASIDKPHKTAVVTSIGPTAIAKWAQAGPNRSSKSEFSYFVTMRIGGGLLAEGAAGESVNVT
jgi:hypothetical protein